MRAHVFSVTTRWHAAPISQARTCDRAPRVFACTRHCTRHTAVTLAVAACAWWARKSRRESCCGGVAGLGHVRGRVCAHARDNTMSCGSDPTSTHTCDRDTRVFACTRHWHCTRHTAVVVARGTRCRGNHVVNHERVAGWRGCHVSGRGVVWLRSHKHAHVIVSHVFLRALGTALAARRYRCCGTRASVGSEITSRVMLWRGGRVGACEGARVRART
jgi:hypothetical protein